jgi:hypothetical protein
MLWERVQIKEPQGSKCMLLEGGGRLPTSEVSTFKCATLPPFKAEEKNLWIEDWLKDLELVQEPSLCLEEEVRHWNLEKVHCLLDCIPRI